MLQYLVRFVTSMVNLVLLQYLLISFKDVKIKTTKLQVVVMIIQSIICAGVYYFHNPRISLVVMVAAVYIESMLIDSVMKYKFGMASTSPYNQVFFSIYSILFDTRL